MSIVSHIITHFSNSALHDEEMGIVDIQLHWAEEILHSVVLNIWAIDEILVLTTNNNLNKETI